MNLRYVRPFVCAMVGGAVGAWFGTVTGIGATAYGVTGLPGFLIVGGYILPYAELLALSGGVAFAATWLFWHHMLRARFVVFHVVIPPYMIS